MSGSRRDHVGITSGSRLRPRTRRRPEKGQAAAGRGLCPYEKGGAHAKLSQDGRCRPPQVSERSRTGRRRHGRGNGRAFASQSAPAPARVNYPSNRLANVKDLKVNEPLNVAYPDEDAPGVLIKLGKRVPSGVGPDGDIVGFSTVCPHKGFPLAYDASGQDPELPRPLLALRLREAARRSGARRRRTSRSTCCASTTRATSTPKASTSCSTAACPTCSEGGSTWLTSVKSTGFRSSRRTPRSTTSPATTASSAAATRPTPGD